MIAPPYATPPPLGTGAGLQAKKIVRIIQRISPEPEKKVLKKHPVFRENLSGSGECL
jgi:hypothetical protein